MVINTLASNTPGLAPDTNAHGSKASDAAAATAVKHPRVLSIAGSDPSGGAGIQADIKSISAHAGYAMAAVTALTAQNTRGVSGVHFPPAEFLGSQLDSVAADITIDAVKIGMLGSAEVMVTVADWLVRTRPPVVVLDPVMVATSGDALMAPEAHSALVGLLGHVDLVTPNIPELAALLGEPEAQSWPEAVDQGRALAAAHQLTVLVKGGHLPGDQSPDALVAPDGTVHEFSAARIDTANTHGTGCSLSAAVATLQVKTGDWESSVRQAKAWLSRALETSGELQVGGGAGPVNHLHALWETAAPGLDAFSRGLWADTAPQLEAILDLDFIKELAAGTLQRNHFAYYLAQDALYLGAYARVLARASAIAPTETEQKFWAAGAQNCLEVEMELHRDWLRHYPLDSSQGPVTKHYVDHLQAVAFSGSYGEVVAAVLPCFWLYAEVGRILHADYQLMSGDHPYGTWLQTYADEAFAQATQTAIAITDAAARRGSALERGRMKAAFAHSAQFEVDFFAAAHQALPPHEIAIGD